MNSIIVKNKAKYLNFLQPTMGLDYIKIDWKKKNNDYEIYKNFINTQTKIDTNYLYVKLRKVCSEYSFCYDISSIAAPGGHEDLYSNARHHNEKGNLIIAKEIYKVIKNQTN